MRGAKIFHTGTSMDELVDTVRSAVKPRVAQYEGNAALARSISLATEGRAPAEPHAVAPHRHRHDRLTRGRQKHIGRPNRGRKCATGREACRGGVRPHEPITGGALLGDRLRVDFGRVDESVFYRSLAIAGEDYETLPEILELIGGAGFDRVIVETVGAGQNETKIRECVDRTAVVVVPGMGDSIQMDKAGILEIADCFVVNKSDYEGLERLRRELKDACGGRPIVETVATEGRGTETLLDTLFG